MDLSTLSDLEYKYKFNTNDLKSACLLCMERNKTLQNLENFPPNSKQTVKEISDDINKLLNKIITRNGIVSLDDYNNAIDAAILANCDIQLLVDKCVLKKDFGAVSKKNPLYNEIKIWQTIQTKLGAKEWDAMIAENHSTIILFLVLSISALFFCIMGERTKSVFLVLESLFLCLIFILLVVVFNKRLHILEDIDRQYRIKNLTHYRSGIKLKSKNQKLLHFLTNIGKKI